MRSVSTSCARAAGALTLLSLALALVLVPSASASHSFTDVPDGHQFHNEIGVLKATNVTSGKECAPPGAPPTFCPEESLRRQGMAAHIARALGLVVRPNESTLKGVPGSRVAMIDDDLSFVGTNAGGLELLYQDQRGFRIETFGLGFPNVIGGHGTNFVAAGANGGTVSGGAFNKVTDNLGAIGGGHGNTAGDDAGTQGDAPFATVSGGSFNRAGELATVPGGFDNQATGLVSFAAGHAARAVHDGTFVWGDSQLGQTLSPGPNTFSVRAGGGIWLGTTDTPSIPAGTFLNTSTGGHLTSGGAWTNASDRALKRDFREVDGKAILRALALMPIHSWSYKAEPGVRHVGPVAQDFKRAFGLGRGDKHIATIDAEGVALAAIKALHAENRALEARLAKLERQLARLAAKRR